MTSINDLLSEIAAEARPAPLYERVTVAAARQRRQRLAAGAAFAAVLVAAGGAAALAPWRPSGVVTVDPPAASPAPTVTSPAPSGAPSTAAPDRPAANDPRRFYVGSWTGHGRQITVRADFTATYTGRTYVACGSPDALPGEPCDDLGEGTFGREVLEMRLERREGRVVARVVESNNPGNGAGTTFALRAHPDDAYFTMRWLSGGQYDRSTVVEVGLCGDATPPEVDQRVCGA